MPQSMTQLNCMVATPPGFLSGTWELTPFQPYAVGSTTVTGPFRGDITAVGLLVIKGGTTAAQVTVPAPNGGYDAGTGILTTNFKTAGGTVPGRPITLPLVETSTGVMDVQSLLSIGRALVITPQQATDFLTLIAQGAAARDGANAAAASARQSITDNAQQQTNNNAATTTNIATMNAASGAVIAQLQNTDALGQLARQSAGGTVSASITAPTFTRASVALHPALGTDVPVDQARTVTRGGRLYVYLDRAIAATMTNLFATPYTPASQIVPLVSGSTYTVTARGGPVALYGAVSALVQIGKSVTFKAGSTQLGVVVGTGVLHVQVELSPWATTRMPLAGRAREALTAVRRVGTFPRLMSLLLKPDSIDPATASVLLEVIDESATPVRVFAVISVGGALGVRNANVDGLTVIHAGQFMAIDLNWTTATTFDLYVNGVLNRAGMTSTSDVTGLRVGTSLATTIPGNNYINGYLAYEEFAGAWTASQIKARFDALTAARGADPATGERYPVEQGGVITADVVIVGGHASGLGAAIRLGQMGYSVVMTCRESTAGGMLTAGQIGFVDGTPNLYWPERPGTVVGQSNGDLIPQTSWSLTGGVWKEFRERVSPTKNPVNVPATYRYQASVAKLAVNQWLTSLPTVRVLYQTSATVATKALGGNGKYSVSGVQVAGPEFTGTLIGKYYVDGTDSGHLIGLLGLPYRTGITDADGYTTTDKSINGVMDYAYRSTFLSNSTGLYPTAAPLYYSTFKLNYDGQVGGVWPTYKTQFGIADGDAAYVHALRVFNNQGRLSGNASDSIIDNVAGYPAGSTSQTWDVNGGMNNAQSIYIARALYTNTDVTAMFARYGITNPLGPADTDIYYKWLNIVWVEDSSPLSADDKTFFVARIKEAAKAATLGFLWYIRSGDMQAKIRTLAGSANVNVLSAWSISNQLGTVDGLPDLMYQREGRRIQSEYTASANAGDTDGWMSIYALSPTYDTDKLRTDKTSQSSPADFTDAVVINDYPVDIHGTAGGAPESYVLPRVHQLPFRTLIPKNTTGLLVGSAVGLARRAFASVRLDGVRLMTGGAIAEAINLSMQTGNKDFTVLDTVALRDALARQYQGTRYSKDTHDWDSTNLAWLRLDVSRAMQRLHARAWLNATWIGSTTGLTTPLPTATLTGANGQGLAVYVSTHGGPASVSMPWAQDGNAATITTLATLTGISGMTGNATVGDAYIWLAGKLP